MNKKIVIISMCLSLIKLTTLSADDPLFPVDPGIKPPTNSMQYKIIIMKESNMIRKLKSESISGWIFKAILKKNNKRNITIYKILMGKKNKNKIQYPVDPIVP